MNEFKTFGDICDNLNISTATVRNWIKTKIIAPPENGKKYSQNEFERIIDVIKSSNIKLTKRANRSMSQNNVIYYCGVTDEYRKKQLLKAVELHKNSGNTIEQSLIALSIIQLESSRLLKKNYLSKPETEIEKFILQWISECRFDINKISLFSEILDIPNFNDDFIGAFYQTILNSSAKSKTGAYYTPAKLLDDICIPEDKSIIDPCCGSGGILLNILSKNHSRNLIYASDIDVTALKICRVNLTMFFDDPNFLPNISNSDLIFENKNTDLGLLNCSGQDSRFDFIVTNPPWGGKFSKFEKNHLTNHYPFLKTYESFSIALYNSIQKLSGDSGRLIFFLPMAFTNVASHKCIRKYLLNGNFEIKIRNLGQAFSGVMSEAVRLELCVKKNKTQITLISNNGDERVLTADEINTNFVLSNISNENDLNIIKKIYSYKHITLKNSAFFALGIVTGNNDKHLLSVKTVSAVPIFKGKDILPFGFKEPENFIEFNPQIYQQVAPIQYYMQKKIMYRFISDKIICALDTENRMPLNSANIFFPTCDYPYESIVCLFNSKLYNFIFKKKFFSKKILRAHLEDFPLPLLSREHHNFLFVLHCEISKGNTDISKIDDFIYSIFDLSDNEIQLIEKK